MTEQGDVATTAEHPFERFEAAVRGLIKSVEVPVLGLLGGLLPAAARAAIQQDLHESMTVRSYARRLDKYPALFGVWLAEHVMYGVGIDGHFSLYPHLQRALGGLAHISNDERDLLWRAFRRAMFKLGIQPLTGRSGNYMADEYIRQAGVPIAYADDLAVRMLHLAKRIGLPDEDDQEGLLTWQSALLNKLSAPFSITARRALERDTQAYYVRAFLRVHANGGHPTNADALEEALAKAFVTESGAGTIRRAAIPQLLYRDGVLGVLFPPTASQVEYELRCGDMQRALRVDAEGGFRPLPSGLHQEVIVQRPDGERVLSVKLWADAMANRLLLFNAEGRLRAAAQLNQEEPIELAPGRYVALCRFEPTSPEQWEELSETPRLVEAPMVVPVAGDVVVRNGPAHLAISGYDLPTFSLDGRVKGSLERLEFWYGTIKATVEVPSDWRQSPDQTYELRVSCGQDRSSVTLELDEGGRATARLSSALSCLPTAPGLRRLVIELARVGDARTVQRQSILYWFGLDGVSYGLRFIYNARPKNLISSSCAGLTVGEKSAEPTDDQSRLVRMGFDIGGGRAVHLSWNRPGIFVEVEQPLLDGSTSTIARSLGATEMVSLTSPKSIVVCASEPGYITLGSMRAFVDFARFPRKVFPASLLASRIEPGARTLAYETEGGGASLPLLELSQPHVATKVMTERLGNLLTVKVYVIGEATDAAVSGKEMSTGREASAELKLLAGTWHQSELARMQVYCAPQGNGHVIYALIDVTTLKPGVWTLGFGARIGGTWGRIEDADEGRISVAVAVDALGSEIPGAEVVQSAKHLELSEVAARLTRLNEHFRQPWSPACWEQQAWLGQYFTVLADRLRDHEGEFVGEIADMAMARPADDVKPGFIAKQSIGASLSKVFAQQRPSYRRINTKPHPLSVALRAIPELRGSVAPAFGAVIHPCAAMAFKNATEVMQGRRPRCFELARYRLLLTQMHVEAAHRLDDHLFLPGNGELLGPLHLAHAWRDLERGFDSSQLLPSSRRAAAIALARTLYRRSSTFDQTEPSGLSGQTLVLHLQESRALEMEPGQELRQEHIERIANACAWLAWHCRMESRRPGALDAFQASLNTLRQQVEVMGPAVSDCVGYYLHVAPAMFSFYLLLWELVMSVELDPIVQNV
jgi:hypothetical protein